MIFRTSNASACLHESRLISIVEVVELPPKQPPDENGEDEESRRACGHAQWLVGARLPIFSAMVILRSAR